jgi:hypothetical protein
MEKKGDLLNQLAIISDLLEKININVESSTIVLELPKTEFDNAFELLQKKYSRKMDKPKDTFTINLGVVNVVFNTSSV